MTPPVPTAGQRLPPLALRRPQDGTPLDIPCSGRTSTILLALHGQCDACAGYARDVAGAAAEIAAWDCRLLMILESHESEDANAKWPTGDDVDITVDSEDSLRRAGVPVPAVLVADPWCELAAVLDGGANHAFPAVSELVDWARYLGTKCPECEGEAL